MRLSGETNIEAAIRFFQNKKVSALIITNGSNPISLFSDGQFFETMVLTQLPISKRVIDELKYRKDGDTTGCGDNFVGGVIASLVNQLQRGVKQPNLQEASSWGVVSGGFACFYLGGTWDEQKAGEKLNKIQPYYNSYQQQINGQ
jgi:sugar/nucleoside kinase (ribokinase family)